MLLNTTERKQYCTYRASDATFVLAIEPNVRVQIRLGPTRDNAMLSDEYFQDLMA